jgi:hypothetical protein
MAANAKHQHPTLKWGSGVNTGVTPTPGVNTKHFKVGVGFGVGVCVNTQHQF